MSYEINFNNADTVYTTVLLSDPAGAFGVKETLSGDIITADGTALTHSGGGNYTYTVSTFDETVDHEYWIEFYDGSVYAYQKLVFTAVSAGRYTSLAEISTRFGHDNVMTWARINDADPASLLALIALSIAEAEDYVDAALQAGLYTIPFTGTIPTPIKTIACLLAGVMIYEAKGVLDFNPDTGQPQHRLHYQKKNAAKMLDSIRNGKLRLVTARAVIDHIQSGE